VASILIIEDDTKTAMALRDGLRMDAHVVVVVTRG
jgi:hypothetical protein